MVTMPASYEQSLYIDSGYPLIVTIAALLSLTMTSTTITFYLNKRVIRERHETFTKLDQDNRPHCPRDKYDLTWLL